MDANRREFLERITGAAGGAALFAGVPLGIGTSEPRLDALKELQRAAAPTQVRYDMSWVSRITGAHKAVYDVPAVESGYGVWRSTIWMNQYRDTLGVAERDITTVLILRHDAIILAMTQAFWDEYDLGRPRGVTHPLTLEVTDRNPALLADADVPAPYSTFALPRFVERGGIVLACDLAFRDCVELVQAKHGLEPAAARERALRDLVPGVIMQPSGVFAAVRAQEAGAVYVRAT
jgi:hypothetical protein